MSDSPAPEKILLSDPPPPPLPKADLIARIAREAGVSPFRQWVEMMRLSYGGAKVEFTDYYGSRLFDPALSMAQKREFIAAKANQALNRSMSPAERPNASIDLLKRKVAAEAHFRAAGVAATQTQATVACPQPVPGVRNLPDAATAAAFFRDGAVYPLFAKPETGSRGTGTALILGHDPATDRLALSDGRHVPVLELATEMAVDYPHGFILQHAVVQHPAATMVAGGVLATVRVLTLHDGTAPRVLYAVWKMPAPGAMSDNAWQEGALTAAVDLATGRLGPARIGGGPGRRVIARHPVSDVVLEGWEIPHWSAFAPLACAAHATLPDLGVLGFDVGIGADGPVIIEANANPFQMLHQNATGRGILTPANTALFDRVVARFRAPMARAA